MIKSIFWFKRDLRLEDNIGLNLALTNSDKVYPVYIFDKGSFQSSSYNDYKVIYTWNAVKALKDQLRKIGSDLIVGYGDSTKIITELAKHYSVSSVYTNEEYDPNIIIKETVIKNELSKEKCDLIYSSDSCIFSPYQIEECSFGVSDYNTYKDLWLGKFSIENIILKDDFSGIDKFAKFRTSNIMQFKELGDYTTTISKKIGFNTQAAKILLHNFLSKKLANYNKTKNNPQFSSSSNLSVHIRFGTISCRTAIKLAYNFAIKNNLTLQFNSWIEQFILRDYFIQLYFHYPSTISKPLNNMMANYPYENNLIFFEKWCQGATGYPIIDASMRQLNSTGLLHYKLRLLVASFLVKHLNVDYRLGEHYFSTRLLDYDPAISIGNWQTISGMNYDSDPFYKFMNPTLQSEKLDKDAKIIKKYIPILSNIPSQYLHNPSDFSSKWEEYGVIVDKDYPSTIIDHRSARDLVLAKYKEFLIDN